jgi:hypothetical protein
VNVYFVTTGLWEEVHVIKKVRPPRLLCSYWYFKNKPLAAFCEELGYTPKILLDSGAYSAYTKGKSVNLLDYLAYIEANRAQLYKYVSLDVIGDERLTWLIYQLMKSYGLDPVAVVHYGEKAHVAMHRYSGRFLALGGTVPVRDKKKVVRWCEEMKRLRPETSLHLLGSSSKALLQSEALASCDSSTWYIQAVNGRPASIPGKGREAKMARAEANMRRIMEEFDEVSVPSNDCGR